MDEQLSRDECIALIDKLMRGGHAALSRNTDPDTSALAALSVEQHAKLAAFYNFWLLTMYGAMTHERLAQVRAAHELPPGKHERSTRRTDPLKRMGLVAEAGRGENARGRSVVIWSLTALGRRAAEHYASCNPFSSRQTEPASSP